jgi:hypothetical protein
MDEIELIREFRNELPGARPHARDAARAALAERFEPSRRAGRLRPRPIRGDQMRMRLIAIAAVMTVGGLAAVGAGAFDREPVAPQLSPEESGVKPGVVPGEVQKLKTPDGTTFYGGVSPCIKSDPAGYSAAELEDNEWCFHEPGAGPAPRPKDRDPRVGVIYELRNGKVREVPLEEYLSKK